MRRILLVCTVLLSLTVISIPAWAGDSVDVTAASDGQSVAPSAHDHGGGCPGSADGSACCSACQVRQKYAKNKDQAAAGGCPCQRAKAAREAAAAASKEGAD